MKDSRRIAGAFIAVAAAVAVSSMASCGSFAGDDESARDARTPDDSIADSSAGGEGSPDSAPPEAGLDTGAARHLRVFVLTSPWGILMSHLADGGTPVNGRPSADLHCADEGASAGLGTSFVAWMSSNGSDAIDRLPNDADWSLPVAGSAPLLVFPSRAHLESGQPPLQPMKRGANGLPITDAENRVWTGTSVMGRATGKDCNNWGWITGTSGTAGRIGLVSTSWTNAGDDPSCNTPFHLYCFGY